MGGGGGRVVGALSSERKLLAQQAGAHRETLTKPTESCFDQTQKRTK